MLALVALLGACAGGDDSASDAASPPPAASPDGGPEADEPGDHDGPGDASGYGDALARFAGCQDIAPYLAGHLEGLVEAEGNTVDEWGVQCGWEPPPGNTDIGQVRTVGVSALLGEQTVLTPDELASVGTLEYLPDPVIEAAGGIVSTMTTGSAVSGVILTTVTLPEVEVVVGGGRWADFPALDGPAAVDLAKSLLDLG